jgi:hypothetical protein
MGEVLKEALYIRMEYISADWQGEYPITSLYASANGSPKVV